MNVAETSRAWSWRHAVTLADLSGDCKHLLLTLSLFMNEEGGSCFPEIETLMSRTGRGKTWVHKYLNEAQQAGWITREQVSRKKKNGDNRGWRRNEYTARWPEHVLPGNPEPESCEKGSSRDEPPSQNVVRETPEGSSREGKKVVREANTNIPENIPENLSSAQARENGADAPEREGGHDGSGGGKPATTRQDGKAKAREIETAFKRFAPKWPKWLASSEDLARKAWQELADNEREQAEDRMQDYVDACLESGITRSGICMLQSYLREKRWERLPAPRAKREGPQSVPRFGKRWMAYRLWLFDKLVPREPAGKAFALPLPGGGLHHVPRDDDMAQRYPFVHWLDHAATTVAAGHSPPDAEDFVRVKVGSDVWHGWVHWHGVRELPAPFPPDHVEFVWFPPEGPEGFELANVPPVNSRLETEYAGSDAGQAGRGQDWEAFGS
jgi:hypothetical protein